MQRCLLTCLVDVLESWAQQIPPPLQQGRPSRELPTQGGSPTTEPQCDSLGGGGGGLWAPYE